MRRTGRVGRVGLLVSTALLCGAIVGCSSRAVQYGGGTYQPEEPEARALFNMNARSAHEAFSDPQRARALHTIALKMLADLTISPDPQTRANAIEAFQRVPDQLEYHVQRGLRDENAGVRAVSAMVVGRQKLTRLVGEVRPLLADESPYVWTAAAYALKACGSTDEPSLNRMVALLLSSPSTRVRSHIAVMLGDLGERSAMGPLTEAIVEVPARTDPRQLRLMELQIAEAMYKLGDEEQAEVIRAALYPSQLYELEAMALAAQILGEIRDIPSAGALVGLARGSRDEVLPAEVRLAAAGSLAQLGHPQGAYIAEEYKSNDNPALRAQSAYVFGRTGQVQNLARLEASLWDPSTLVRAAAADGILRILDRSNTRVNHGP